MKLFYEKTMKRVFVIHCVAFSILACSVVHAMEQNANDLALYRHPSDRVLLFSSSLFKETYEDHLELAIKQGNLAAVEKLINENSEKINADLAHNTPLVCAVEWNKTEIVKFLLSKPGIDPNKGIIPPIQFAKTLAMHKLLIEHGSFDHHKKDASGWGVFVSTLLTAFDNREEIIEFMLQNGADPNQIFLGKPLLLRVISSLHQQHIPILLEYGAEVTDEAIAKANKKELDFYILQLLQDYRNAVKCIACPKWYSESEHKNQESFVCNECKEKNIAVKNDDKHDIHHDLRQAITKRDFNTIKEILLSSVRPKDEIIKQAETQKLHPYIIMLLNKYKNSVKCIECMKWYPGNSHEQFVCDYCNGNNKNAECFICGEASTDFVICSQDHKDNFMCKGCYTNQINNDSFTCPLCRSVTPEFVQ